MSIVESRDIGLTLAAGLAELHGAEIVHRDLKPRNVLSLEGDWKIADFGISKNLSRVVTQKTFQQYGTKGYAAPEQFDGVAAKPSADVYSLGKILVFLLSGQTDVDHISFPAWRQLIQRCIETDPGQRPDIAEVTETLQNIPI